MPKSGRGKYPLRGCIQWYIAYWRDRAQGRTEDDSRKRKSAAEALIWESRAKQSTGDLIERAEVLEAWTSIAARLGKAFESLPNNLAREFNWPPETIRAFRQALDDFRRTFVRESAGLIGETNEASAETKAA